jgi:hypothetical protein
MQYVQPFHRNSDPLSTAMMARLHKQKGQQEDPARTHIYIPTMRLDTPQESRPSLHPTCIHHKKTTKDILQIATALTLLLVASTTTPVLSQPITNPSALHLNPIPNESSRSYDTLHQIRLRHASPLRLERRAGKKGASPKAKAGAPPKAKKATFTINRANPQPGSFKGAAGTAMNRAQQELDMHKQGMRKAEQQMHAITSGAKDSYRASDSRAAALFS